MLIDCANWALICAAMGLPINRKTGGHRRYALKYVNKVPDVPQAPDKFKDKASSDGTSNGTYDSASAIQKASNEDGTYMKQSAANLPCAESKPDKRFGHLWQFWQFSSNFYPYSEDCARHIKAGINYV